MSTTFPASAIAEQAAAFASQVRARLNYLAPDELDELLDGLDAELEERLTEGRELGDPAQYAEELRQAADLPPRPSAGKSKAGDARRRSLGEDLAGIRTAIAAWFSETPARSGLRDFVLSLRPVWWIARAAVLACLLLLFVRPRDGYLPVSLPTLALLLAFTIVSVQWGRGKWLPRTWLKVMRTAASVLAILALPFMIGLGTTFLSNAGANASSPYPYGDFVSDGLVSHGRTIENIFAYDCEGNPINGVRLYDQDGVSISTDSLGNAAPVTYYSQGRPWHQIYDANPLAIHSNNLGYVYPLSLSAIDDSTGTPIYKVFSNSVNNLDVPPLVPDCPAPGDLTGGGSGN